MYILNSMNWFAFHRDIINELAGFKEPTAVQPQSVPGPSGDTALQLKLLPNLEAPTS